ncbi:hypothetical protein [Promicromonospora umidemergens]|uniref:Uncharacterized protein n=1 Tax=Promicromonospora umidemergens TaxID=629679 RepID=A0ABP8XPB1_9MICO|nr:hypothetical protein [Promicromonospora umidemergens]
MNQWDEGFRDAFSSFVRESGRWRDFQPETLLARWATFVADCEDGYPSDAEDYFNDLTSRDSLSRALGSTELQRFPDLVLLGREVEKVDSAFRVLLIPDAFPRIPAELWWSRGVVKFARKCLVEELWRDFQLELELVE